MKYDLGNRIRVNSKRQDFWTTVATIAVSNSQVKLCKGTVVQKYVREWINENPLFCPHSRVLEDVYVVWIDDVYRAIYVFESEIEKLL